ncbi:uncharacterized protein LOC131009977 [Salvia miltiorrhiza]|uniref:uncharacterized protein LOC131009977 n=1 Tax=Salvia miltiorrhiza TaxID=226208 RepID=UPI0025AC7B28|nr:uncharacterized protein LOC131009977 [Salvia miltiorrhiza]
MGGSMKGAHGHMHSSNSRRKWSSSYVVMAIVCCVFGCGMLGLMGIHRLRERRSHNLLIKQRDDQILSLHLLLQKERERVVEAKRKAEAMKTKMASLGSQKAELGAKMSEMQSTISSLREEQRAVESAFQEKQSEVNLLREKYAADLRQREGEIEGLKLRLQLRSAEVGPNATMVEAKATESTTTTSSENEEVEPRSMKEHEHEKAADDEGSPRRFRGKHGYLRRSKGRRWIGKQTQGKRTYPSDRGASTMADNALRNSSSATKMDGDGVQKEQTGEETSIAKPAEEKNENQQHTAERNGEEQDGDAEESEETNEPEF